MNRPFLIIALVALGLSGLFLFVGSLGALVMPLLVIGCIAHVVASMTGL